MKMKMKMNRTFAIAVLITCTSACTTTDKVVFVTKSSLSIVDVESTSAQITVGYDRVEGYFAPAYSNGALPPVVSSIKTDGGLFAPKIQQLYATGQAANLVVSDKKYVSDENDELKGDKKGMFFGTSTNLGFKVGVTQGNPSVNIGYKRIEASYIPLGREDGVDVYPSVIASIDTTITVPPGQEKNPDGLQVGQYFATGTAAKHLATKDYVRRGFKEKAQGAFKKYEEELNKQQEFALSSLKCAASLTDEQWPQVILSASSGKLVSETMGDLIDKRWQQYLGEKTVKNRQEATKLYFTSLSKLDGASPTKTPVLEAHKDLVCALANVATDVLKEQKDKDLADKTNNDLTKETNNDRES